MNGKPSDLVLQAIRSLQSFAEVLPHLKSLIKSADLGPCKLVVTQIKKSIKDRKTAPPQKLLALDLLQECMKLKNPNFLGYVQNKILERLSILVQRKAKELFKDSNKSPEFLSISEEFLAHLREYLQIWGIQFGRTTNGELSMFGIFYSKLKANKVEFPRIEPVHQPHKRQTGEREAIPKVEVKSNTRSDKETLEYFENLLTIIEEIENPYSDETGKELISNMLQLKNDVGNLLNAALSSENALQIENIFSLNERMQKIESKKNQRSENRAHFQTEKVPMRKTEIFPKVEEVKVRISTPPKKSDIFDNILDLDFSPPPSASQFRTYTASNPLLFPSPVMEKGKNHEEIVETPNPEVEELKRSLEHKEETISMLNKEVLNLKLKLDHLDSALKRTTALLAAKEKDCEEYHCLKASQHVDIIESLLASPKTSSIHIVHEAKMANDDIFKLLCVKNVAILFDNNLFQLGFQFVISQEGVKMVNYIGNKSQAALTGISLEIDTPYEFEMHLTTEKFEEILPQQQKTFEITCKLLANTHIYPKLKIQLQGQEYVLKLPINIGKFAKKIDLEPEKMWTEWDELMFDSDLTSEKSVISRKSLPKILQFSENIKILTSSDLKKILKNQYFFALSLSEFVFALVTVDKSQGQVDVETRSNNVNLRQSLLLLLLSQLID